MGLLVSHDTCSRQYLTAAAKKSVLDGQPTLDKIAERLRSGAIKRVVIMSGAGTSVAAGIPDFRSPNTGLYSQLKDLDLPCPEAVFSIEYFKHNPQPFYTLARRFFPGNFHPTDAHFFAALLQQKNLLLRQYTQNVDNLELLAGVLPDRLVEAHGSFANVHCIKCRKQFPIRWFRDALLSDEVDVLRCSQLQARFANDQTINNKPEHFDKASSSASFSHQSQTTSEEEALHKHTDVVKTEPWWKSKDWTASTCDGLVKPDVTFFGEKLPRRFWEMTPRDLAEADLLIVLGTSLQVYPFAEMVNMVSPYCPRLLINREATGMESNYRAGFQFFKEDNYRDVLLLGECQSEIRQLCVLLQWEPELQKLREQYEACPKEDHWTVLEKLQVEDPPHSADELNLYETAFHELDNDSSE